jgi:hypothetical protein
MAKAIIPLSQISEVWGIDSRNTRAVDKHAEREFLRSLHEKDR